MIKTVLLHVGAEQWASDFKPTVTSFIAAETAALLDLMKQSTRSK